MAEAGPRGVLLAGASGFIGRHVLDALLEAPDLGRVIAVTRRPLGREHSRLANRIVQFDKLESQLKGLTGHVALCCLGTTLTQAGSLQALRRVELDYVLSFAAAAKAAQAQRFVVVSAAGADRVSKNPHLRAKAEMEQALAALGFGAVDVLRPAWVLGWRRSMSPVQACMAIALPLLHPLLFGAREVWRGVPVSTLAAAMVSAARSDRKGLQRYAWPGIRVLASRRGP